MECLFYFCHDGCTFDSQATAAWLQALGSLIAVGVAVAIPYYHHTKISSLQKREQAQRIQKLADLVYLPICELIQKLKTENFETEKYRQDIFKVKQLKFVVDELDQIKSVDCPSPELIKPLRDFRDGVRGFIEKIESIKHFFHGQAENTRMSLLYDLEPFTKALHAGYAEIAKEPQKYR